MDSIDLSHYNVLISIFVSNEPLATYRASTATYWNCVLLEAANIAFVPLRLLWRKILVDYVWNVMAHAQKPDFVFRRKKRVHLNRRWRQFSRLLAAEVCESALVMLDTPCTEVVWTVLATHSIRQFLLHFPSLASPCAITFRLDSTLDRLELLPTTKFAQPWIIAYGAK